MKGLCAEAYQELETEWFSACSSELVDLALTTTTKQCRIASPIFSHSTVEGIVGRWPTLVLTLVPTSNDGKLYGNFGCDEADSLTIRAAASFAVEP
jgi:hypothetical protein